MDNCWDAKCQVQFNTVEARIQHTWLSGLHIICECCAKCSNSFGTVPQDFQDLEELLEHNLATHYACEICSTPECIQTFNSQQDLQDHLFFDHCACTLCRDTLRLFDDINILRMHIESYHNGCSICNSETNILAFESVTELLIHLEDDHHACIFRCGAPVFENAQALRQHYVVTHYGCSHCSIRSFQNERERNEHYDNVHYGLRRETSSTRPNRHPAFPCKLCNTKSSFTNQASLSSHLRTSHGTINCPDPTCKHPPRIAWPPYQRAHMETCHHPNPRSDFDTDAFMRMKNCPICNHPFRKRGNVLEHYRRYHRCRECESYIAIYYKYKNEHISQYHGGDSYEYQYPPFDHPRRKPSAPPPSPSPPSYSSEDSTPSPSPPPRPRPPPAQIDIYTLLRIHPHCSNEDAKRAAKQRRIETHPDRLKKEGMTGKERDAIDEMAKMVGWAADVVGDEGRRGVYDREMRVRGRGR